MRSAVAHAHEILRAHIAPGDAVIDATAGNGHDTLFLAQLVAPDGIVFAFDIQTDALTNTRRRLEDAGMLPDTWQLVPLGHERMADRIPQHFRGRIAAVVFNLGYLPGGDKNVITSPATTLPAMSSALRLLRPGGILVAVLYTGHPGGSEEEETVRSFASEHLADGWEVTWHRPGPTLRPAPSVLSMRSTRQATEALPVLDSRS